MIYLLLFYEFFKIGIFSFGGGLVMLPLMQDIIFKYSWLSNQEFLDIIAISQVTPGPIAINAATFIGYKVGGILGGVVATLASALPSFIIILIVARVFDIIKKSRKKDFFFIGVRPVILALISFAGVIIAKPTFFVKDLRQVIGAFAIFLIVFLVTKYVRKINPVIVLLVASLCGVYIF